MVLKVFILFDLLLLDGFDLAENGGSPLIELADLFLFLLLL